MPANFPLHLALTQEQSDWILEESKRTQKTKSKIVQDLIEDQRLGKSHGVMMNVLSEKIDQMRATQQVHFTNSDSQVEIVLAYIKEVFRESAANLFRINAIIDDFQEPEKMRSEVNNFVREQENYMRTKCAQIREIYS